MQSKALQERYLQGLGWLQAGQAVVLPALMVDLDTVLTRPESRETGLYSACKLASQAPPPTQAKVLSLVRDINGTCTSRDCQVRWPPQMRETEDQVNSRLSDSEETFVCRCGC